MNIFNAQKARKHMNGIACGNKADASISGNEGLHTLIIWYIAAPPIQVWIPNHPQATIARRIAGMLAPRTPKLARAKTGNRIAAIIEMMAITIKSSMRVKARTERGAPRLWDVDIKDLLKSAMFASIPQTEQKLRIPALYPF